MTGDVEMGYARHIDLLGKKAKDRVTGISGVITCISYDLYGCIQALLVPAAADGKSTVGAWYDISRLNCSSNKRVMPIPAFELPIIATGEKGPAEKPARDKLPRI